MILRNQYFEFFELHSKVSVLGRRTQLLEPLVSDLFAVLVQVQSEELVSQLLLDCLAEGSADVCALVLLGMDAVDQLP